MSSFINKSHTVIDTDQSSGQQLSGYWEYHRNWYVADLQMERLKNWQFFRATSPKIIIAQLANQFIVSLTISRKVSRTYTLFSWIAFAHSTGKLASQMTGTGFREYQAAYMSSDANISSLPDNPENWPSTKLLTPSDGSVHCTDWLSIIYTEKIYTYMYIYQYEMLPTMISYFLLTALMSQAGEKCFLVVLCEQNCSFNLYIPERTLAV